MALIRSENPSGKMADALVALWVVLWCNGSGGELRCDLMSFVGFILVLNGYGRSKASEEEARG